MAQKFVEVTGLHKVFPELSDSSLDLTQIIEDVSNKINHNSILFMTADASDASYGFPEDSKYIWTRDRLYYTNDDEITSDPVQTVEDASVFIDTYTPLIIIEDSGSALSQELQPNILYKFPVRSSALTLTLAPEQPGKACEYHAIIDTSTSAPTITWPAGISWNTYDEPTITASKTYEISILNNIAVYIEV